MTFPEGDRKIIEIYRILVAGEIDILYNKIKDHPEAKNLGIPLESSEIRDWFTSPQSFLIPELQPKLSNESRAHLKVSTFPERSATLSVKPSIDSNEMWSYTLNLPRRRAPSIEFSAYLPLSVGVSGPNPPLKQKIELSTSAVHAFYDLLNLVSQSNLV